MIELTIVRDGHMLGGCVEGISIEVWGKDIESLRNQLNHSIIAHFLFGAFQEETLGYRTVGQRGEWLIRHEQY